MMTTDTISTVLLRIGISAATLIILPEFSHAAGNGTTNQTTHVTSLTSISTYPTPVFMTFHPYIHRCRNHSSTVIFIHDFAENRLWWKKELNAFRAVYIRVVSPDANRMPITWKKGKVMTSWFDFGGDETPKIDQINIDFRKSADHIHKLLDDEIKLGIPPSQIAIAGIQQGAMLALYSGLTYHKKLAAIVAMSPWHPLPITYNATAHYASKDIPICLLNTDGNIYTSNEMQHVIKQHLKDFSNQVEVKTFSGEHNYDDAEFTEAGRFCKRRFDPEYLL